MVKKNLHLEVKQICLLYENILEHIKQTKWTASQLYWYRLLNKLDQVSQQ